MRFLVMCLLIFTLALPHRTAAAAPPEIWYNPLNATDFPNMWDDDSQWAEASKKVNVLVLVHWWVRRPENLPTLIKILDYAKKHKMQIDLDIEVVAKFEAETCGIGEGYTYPGEIAQAIKILSDLNVRLDWIGFDEPLWFGSYSTDPVKCRLTIPQLIDRSVLVLKDVLAVYPHVKIVQLEPIPGLMQVATWREDLTAFRQGLHHALGVTIRVLKSDVQWSDPSWPKAVADMRSYLRLNQVGFGIFYNGSDQSTSDAAWINSAVNNIEIIEGKLGIIPIMAEFTTWNPNPTYNLPESAPTTQAWLVNRYARPLSTLAVQFEGVAAKGRLADGKSAPIAGATVRGFIPGVNFARPLPVTTVNGTVPPNATHAIIGIRVNNECGVACDGFNNLLFSTINYRETADGASQMSLSYPTTETKSNGVTYSAIKVGGSLVNQVVAPPGKTVVINSDLFPVTPNATFRFDIPAATVGGSGWYGNVILIWIDDALNGINRLQIVPDPGKSLMSSAVTSADGRFRLRKLPKSVDGPAPVTVEFDGAGTHRSVVWTPLR